jgi:hypothetical protein
MGGAPPPPPPPQPGQQPPQAQPPQFTAPPGAPQPGPPQQGQPAPAAQSPGSAPAGATGIEVTTGFFWLAFLYFFFKPTIVIDGVPTKTTWGTQFFGVAPGRHHVHIFFRYVFMDAGQGDVDVDVAAGQVRRVKYRTPWFVFSKGKISQS